MADTGRYEAMLRAAGLRATAQRAAVLRALARSDDHPTAEEVATRAAAAGHAAAGHAAAGQATAADELPPSGPPATGATGPVATASVATVYRALAALEGAGLVRRLSLETPARYEMTPTGEHDHLVDVETGEVVEIDLGEAGARLAALRAEAAARLGYDVVSQHTVLRGRRRG